MFHDNTQQAGFWFYSTQTDRQTGHTVGVSLHFKYNSKQYRLDCWPLLLIGVHARLDYDSINGYGDCVLVFRKAVYREVYTLTTLPGTTVAEYRIWMVCMHVRARPYVCPTSMPYEPVLTRAPQTCF